MTREKSATKALETKATSVDISQISQSRDIQGSYWPQGLTYKQMDGRSMELPDANFNVVIDKVNEWWTSGQW